MGISKIYTPLIDDNNLNHEYKNLLILLAGIRNLMHYMGVSFKDNTITYKNVSYKFEKVKF